MLVKTPLKKKKKRKNKRKASSLKKSRKPPTNHGRRIKKGNSKFSLPDVAPWKIILGIIIVGLLGLLYLKNVFATQKLLAEVQKKQRQYNQAKRRHDIYKLKYDRMIGPSEIYKKAKARGFINGGPAEKVIEVQHDE